MASELSSACTGIPDHGGIPDASHATEGPVEITHARPSDAAGQNHRLDWYDAKFQAWCQEIAAVGAKPAPRIAQLRPVLDPDTAQVDPAALRQAMRELVALLPPMPENASPLRRQRHAQVCAEIEAIARLADRLPALPPADQGLALRDAFARASRSARQLASHLSGSLWRRWKPEPQLAAGYAGVAALLGALKDRHRTAAAVHIAQRDARREAERLTQAGWRQGHAGDALVNGSSASALHMGAPLAGGGLRWQDWRFNDDDSKMYYVEQLCAFGEAGLGGELGAGTAKVSGKYAGQFGRTVLMSLDQQALAKLVLNHHANRAAFTADGPRARSALARLEKLSALAQRALGKHYTGTPAAPCLGDARLAKGANSAKLGLVTETIDTATGGTRFADWLQRAYPPVPGLLRERLDQGRPLPKDLVQSAVGVSMVYRAQPLGQHQGVLSGEAAAGIGQAMHGELEAGATVAGSQGVLHFFFALPRAAHELLDPAHTRDLRQTLAMHAALERTLGDRPVMGPYHQVERMLVEQRGVAAAAPAWTPRQEEDIGSADAVPASFHRAVLAPSAAALDAVAGACGTLEAQALALVDCAGLLRARPSKHWPAAMTEALAHKREAAFQTLAAQVFDGRPPCTLAQAMKRPEDFIARCHDAVSLGLARAQTQRWVLAHGLARDATDDAEAAAALARADAAVARVRTVLEGGHLGLTRRRITQDASLQAHATYQRHETALKVSAGTQPAAPAPTALALGGVDAPLDISLRTSAGRIGISGEARWQVADHQINPGRLGEFLQLTFKAEGGAPLLGDHVRDVVLRALKARFPGTALQALEAQTAGLGAQLQGLALDTTAGASVVVKLRRAPGCGSWDLQFVRGYETRASGIDASAQVATPGGLVKLGLQSGTSAQTCVFAAFGPDLGNLGMQMVTLERVLGGQKQGRSVKGCFDADPGATTMYFGLPETVPAVLQRFIEHEDDAARTAGAALPRPLPNEFYRFYDTAPFARIARTGRDLAPLKPGQPPGAAAPELVSVRARFAAHGVDWEAAKRHIATLRTPEERLAWYDGPGRPVFDAFVAVLRELDAHTAAFIAHGGRGPHGFVMSVNDRK